MDITCENGNQTIKQSTIDRLPNDHFATTLAKAIDSSEAVKPGWCPITDTFEFNSELFASVEITTKRMLLSEGAKLFDPLDWLAPMIIKAKVILQQF